MGSFYGNVTVCRSDAPRVAKALEARRVAAEVIGIGPHVVVFAPSAEAEAGGPEELARDLSGDLGATTVAALVLDSDVVLLWLHVDGVERDRFISDPELLADMLDDEAEGMSEAGGDVDVWVGALPGADPGAVRDAFRRAGDTGDDSFVFAEEAHDLIVSALALPDLAVNITYDEIDEGALPDDLARISVRP